MPTAQQVTGWIADLVAFERTRLPYGHPRRSNAGGAGLAEVRRTAQNAAKRLRKHGLYDHAEVLRRAAGGASAAVVEGDGARQPGLA